MIRPVPGETGTLDPSVPIIMLIGRNPGREENQKGRPFVGSAGYMLDQMLAQAGISRDTVYITNLVKCHTINDVPPTPTHINCCLPILLTEVDQIKPKVILGMGSEVLLTVGGKKGITDWRGSIWKNEELGLLNIFTYHPAFILRGNQHMIGIVIEDMRKAQWYATHEWKEPEWNYITKPAEAEDWFNNNFPVI